MKNLPTNEDSSIEQIQGLFDHVRYGIEYQMESNGELTEANENNINETMNIVEKYVCTALYNKFVLFYYILNKRIFHIYIFLNDCTIY
jgi:hypothetical protein